MKKKSELSLESDIIRFMRWFCSHRLELVRTDDKVNGSTHIKVL